MGCDIHLYVEYSDNKRKDERNQWYGFAEINARRCYRLFSAMAAVRGEGESCLFAPQGMPENAGYQSSYDQLIYVREEGDTDSPESVSREKAESWVESGASVWHDKTTKTYITNPDYHSHSWLTTQGFEQAIKHAEEMLKKDWPKEEDIGLPLGYRATLEAMKFLESRGQVARVVFFFDN